MHQLSALIIGKVGKSNSEARVRVQVCSLGQPKRTQQRMQRSYNGKNDRNGKNDINGKTNKEDGEMAEEARPRCKVTHGRQLVSL